MITTSFTEFLCKKENVTGMFIDVRVVRVMATSNTSLEPRQHFDNEDKRVLLLSKT